VVGISEEDIEDKRNVDRQPSTIEGELQPVAIVNAIEVGLVLGANDRN
jgi:hypothetical protein